MKYSLKAICCSHAVIDVVQFKFDPIHLTLCVGTVWVVVYCATCIRIYTGCIFHYMSMSPASVHGHIKKRVRMSLYCCGQCGMSQCPMRCSQSHLSHPFISLGGEGTEWDVPQCTVQGAQTHVSISAGRY